MTYQADPNAPLVQPTPLNVAVKNLMHEIYYGAYVMAVDDANNLNRELMQRMPTGADLYPLTHGETLEQNKEVDKILKISHFLRDNEDDLHHRLRDNELPLPRRVELGAKRLAALCQIRDHVNELFDEKFGFLMESGSEEQRNEFRNAMQEVLRGRLKEALFGNILASGEPAIGPNRDEPHEVLRNRRALEDRLVGQVIKMSDGTLGAHMAGIQLMRAESAFFDDLRVMAGVKSKGRG